MTFSVAPNSDYTTYVVNLSANVNWNGQTMTELKFDPVNNASSGHIDIEFISLNNLPANTPPSFIKGVDVIVNEDAPAQTRTGWATAISPGPPAEAGQQVQFVLSGVNSALYAEPPAISPAGTLTFTPAANAFGTNTLTAAIEDDAAGWLGGGNHRSAPQTFLVTINSVNDVPAFSAGANQTAARGAAMQTIAGWAAGISAGAANESAQTLTFLVTATPANLFAQQPAIASNGTLTFRPSTTEAGTATVSVRLRDNGGTANGGQDTSAPQTFTITVTRPALPQDPRMDWNSAPGASTIELTLPGTAGLLYDLETSTDLVNWQKVETKAGTDAPILFRYTPPAAGTRFFKARIY